MFFGIRPQRKASFPGLILLLGLALCRPTLAAGFAICPEQESDARTFALCAAASCWMVDQVAYCQCDLKEGKSISQPFNYREGVQRKNVCNLLQEGAANGFTLSTYATPRQITQAYNPAVEKLGPPQALYTCDPNTDSRALNAYSAQCDGGVCFLGSRGQYFPGLGQLAADQVVCSCPPVRNATAFQVIGPWRCEPGAKNRHGECCDRLFYQQSCGKQSVKRTGTVIAVGAPAGAGRRLSKKLDGERIQVNQCRFP